MLLHSLHLNNFKRFRDEEISFSDGITGIVGNNGAGKSTIIEAVFFALYGLKRGPGIESDYIVSAGAGPKESCEVRLDFEIGGEDFSLVRTFRRTKSSTTHQAQLNRGEALLAVGVTPVEQQVVRLLGMSATDFKNTIYAAQKDLLSLLDDTPGGRRAWIMRMLGIDYLKKESDAILRDREAECRRQMAGLDYYLEAHSTDILLRDQAQVGEEILSLQASLDTAIGLKAGIDDELRVLYEKRRELESLQRRFEELNGSIRARSDACARISDECRALEEEIAALKAMDAELKALGDAAGTLEEAQRVFQAQRDERDRHTRVCEEEKRLRNALNGLRDRKSRLQRQIEALEEDVAISIRLKGVARRREDAIAALSSTRAGEKEYNRIAREIDRSEYQYRSLETRVASLREALDRCRAVLEETGMPDDIAGKIDETTLERTRVNEQIGSVSADISATDQMHARILGHLEEIRKAGKEGSCPTCRRPLGSSYTGVVADLEVQLAALKHRKEDLVVQRSALASGLNAADNACERLQTLLGRSQEAARLREGLLCERDGLLKEADSCLHRRDELDVALRQLGYDPDAVAALQDEIDSLDSPWRQFLGAQERLKSRDGVEEEYLQVTEEESAVGSDLSRLEGMMAETEYNEAAYLEAEKALDRAAGAHQRFITLTARVEDLPLRINRLAGKKDEIAAIEMEIATMNDELEALVWNPDLQRELESVIDLQKDRRDELIRSISKTQADVESLRRREAGLAESIAQNMLREEQRAAFEEEIRLLATTRNIITDFIVYLLNAVRSGIEGELGRILGQITDGRYENVIVGEDFTVQVEDMGEFYPVGRFSGGEQDDIAIALRIALSRYLAEFHGLHESTFLIFDEIFGSQDEERRNNLIQALRTQESLFPQIFLISHIPEIQGEFSNTLQVVMESGATSRVREVTI